MDYDFIIIGAGIIGTMIARELSRYECSILLIDKESDVGMGASSANSAIIHAGYDPKPGTLKAEMNVLGNKLWEEFSAELDIPFKRTGSYVVSIGEGEFRGLDALYQKGISNAVPGLRILQKHELFIKEPQVSPEATAALYAPSAGVIDPFRAVVAVAENAVMNGVKLLIETEFEDFIIKNKSICGIKTNRGIFKCRWAINAAGVYSDFVMHKANIRIDYDITPRRGEYLIFDAGKVSINNVLFPVPSEKSKGTLVSTTTHGNVMIGPNAHEVKEKGNTATTSEGFNEVIENAKKLVPSINPSDVIAEFAGVRATGKTNDFVVEIPEEVKGFVNLYGIDSPGLASAPAIARRVIELLKEQGEKFANKKDFNPIRKSPPCFHKLSHKEKAELVRKNPAYGRIVCRCEEITEGEVIDAIRSIIPAHTYDGIKRRTWLGTGRCQGGFDYPRVISILSNELKIPATVVSKKGRGSEFILRHTKDY